MMNTDDMTPEEREEFWAMAIEEFQQSGMSKSAYCQQNDLSYSTFRYWLRKFEDRQAAMEDHGMRFAELRLSALAGSPYDGSPVAGTFQTELAILYNGIVISINQDTPMPLLSDVIGVIRDAQ